MGLALFPELIEMEYARGVVPDHLAANPIDNIYCFGKILFCRIERFFLQL
jgi:hypothetical protein